MIFDCFPLSQCFASRIVFFAETKKRSFSNTLGTMTLPVWWARVSALEGKYTIDGNDNI